MKEERKITGIELYKELLKNKIVEEKTHNKAIQKAIESYRLTQQQKEYLRSLKIKNK